MNILLTNHELLMPGGSETYCYTMAEEFNRLGHNVTVFTPKPGLYANSFSNIAEVIPIPQLVKKQQFDIAINQHRVCWNMVEAIECFKIWNSNGNGDIAMPNGKCDRYVAVSEEVQERANFFGYTPEIVRNGINCDRFRPCKKVSSRLESVLLISNHKPGVIDIVAQACELSKVNFKHIGANNWICHVESQINDADLVISLGRGAYEAMACGRNVIIFDYLGAEGFVTPETLQWMKICNCSGRVKRKQWDAVRLSEEFKKYNPNIGRELRDVALKNYNIKIVIEGHIKAYQGAGGIASL